MHGSCERFVFIHTISIYYRNLLEIEFSIVEPTPDMRRQSKQKKLYKWHLNSPEGKLYIFFAVTCNSLRKFKEMNLNNINKNFNNPTKFETMNDFFWNEIKIQADNLVAGRF